MLQHILSPSVSSQNTFAGHAQGEFANCEVSHMLLLLCAVHSLAAEDTLCNTLQTPWFSVAPATAMRRTCAATSQARHTVPVPLQHNRRLQVSKQRLPSSVSCLRL